MTEIEQLFTEIKLELILWFAVFFFVWMVLRIGIAMIGYTPREDAHPNWVKFFGFVLGIDLSVILFVAILKSDLNGVAQWIENNQSLAVVIGLLGSILLGFVMPVFLDLFVSWLED